MTTLLSGQFGNVKAAIDDLAFPYFGETVRVHPQATDLGFYEMMRAASNIDLGEIDMDDQSSWSMEQRVAMQTASNSAVGVIEQQVHPDDMALFLKTAKANSQNLVDLIATSELLAKAVAEHQAGGFPTTPSVGSSTGRQSTGQRSAAVSSLRAPRRGRGSGNRASRSDTDRALVLLEGRADLQEIVLMGEENAAAG